MSSQPDAGNRLDLDSDLNAVRKRYRRERDKRLQTDGFALYREIKSEATHNDIDPHLELGFTRAPIEKETEVVINGEGFGGLLMGVRLRDSSRTQAPPFLCLVEDARALRHHLTRAEG